MKIQAINVNFKGLFTDKQSQNNGDWKMEYSPYSWEKKSNGEFGMAPQRGWDIFDTTLPDNERKYINNKQYTWKQSGRESCKDILGTEFYYCDYDKNSKRTVITEVPAMNLEDSLKVRDTKLNRFLELKKDKQKELNEKFEEFKDSVSSHNSEYKMYSNDYGYGYWERARSKDEDKYYMDRKQNELYQEAYYVQSTIAENNKLRDSIDVLNKEIAEGQQKIALLKYARENNNLIDISQRDIYDPNKPLWEALQNVSSAAGKLIALPFGIITVNELIKMIGKGVKESEIADKGIKIIDRMISTRI